MFIESKRLSIIKPSPTLLASSKALELRKLGKDIIDLTVGEPDFQTPIHIINAAKIAMDSGKTKYTAVDGTQSLKEAIIRKLKRENNLDYEINQISVGCGAKHVIYNMFMASLNEGDEVIIPKPYWVSYPDMVMLCGGKPIFLESKKENGFKVSSQDIMSAISEKTKWLIINSPSNPTGSVYSDLELRNIANLLIQYPNINIMTDDIYEHLIYDSLKFHNILNIEPKLYNQTTVVNGGSKCFSMTGFRIGYSASGSSALIKSMGKIQSHSTSNPCSISQYALESALDSDNSFLDQWRKIFENRRNIAIELLNKSQYFDIEKKYSNGAFYLFVDYSRILSKSYIDENNQIKSINNDSDFSQFLLTKANVSIVSGEAFGMHGYFRMSYAVSDERLKEACNRILKELENLR